MDFGQVYLEKARTAFDKELARRGNDLNSLYLPASRQAASPASDA
jgi:hypothetical protein